MNKTAIKLGTVQETLLITLWARAVEAKQAKPIIRDPKSVEIIQQLDYDFSKLAKAKNSQLGVCLRGVVFDRWVESFLAKNPEAIFVEIGSGLNTRFERVDNGKVTWFDLDLPDSIELKKQFFQESDRRKFIATSILDNDWIELVKAAGNKPIMFAAEGVFMYLKEEQIKQIFATIDRHFPNAYLAFDSMGAAMQKNSNKYDAVKHFDAKFVWAIEDVKEIENWNSNYRVVEVVRFNSFFKQYFWRMGLLNIILFSLIPAIANSYRLSLFQLGSID
jgi:O-methyltransferase involved in polyketide biosynthesis